MSNSSPKTIKHKRASVDLSSYDNSAHDSGAGKIKMILWYYTNLWFFKSAWLPIMGIKRALLKLFGAKLGQGVIIKPSVNIKYPWKLEIGHHVWLGEGVWIDNLEPVVLGDNVCLSQNALLLTGGHSISKVSFDYESGPIVLEEGVWIGAQAVVGQNVRCGSHSILGINAVAESDLKPYTVYKGNPAIPILERSIKAQKPL
ncbi:MAG: WcaF family extracellular polysaccharide biosynthesis acetyltransferase [Bacteroidota bacterium]